jgi:hypothetical protein
MYVRRNVEACSGNHCCSGKETRITYSECVFEALSINHAERMRCITLSSAAWLYHIFRHYLVNGTIFGKTFMNMCFEFLYTLSETFLILWRIQRYIIMYIGLHVSTRYSTHILIKRDFSRHIFEKYSNIKRHENPSCGAELFHAGGRTDWQTYKQTWRSKLSLFATLRTSLITR